MGLVLGAFLFITLSSHIIDRVQLPFFKLIDIEISNKNLPKGIRAELRKKMVGFLGVSLFQIDYKKVHENLVHIKEVDTFSLRKSWPHKLQIKVKLKTGVAFTYYNNKLWKISEDGVLVNSIESLPSLPFMQLRENQVVRLSGGSHAVLAEIAPYMSKIFNIYTKYRRQLWGRYFSYSTDLGVIAHTNLNDQKVILGQKHLEAAWAKAWLANDLLGPKMKRIDARYVGKVIAKKVN